MVKDLGFFASVSFRDNVDGLPKSLLRDNELIVMTKNLMVSINCFANVEVFQDESDEVIVILYGQLLDGVSLFNFVEQYKSDGIFSVKSLNGSFALLLIDKTREKIVLFTDRLCSRKLYTYQKNSTLFISTVFKHLFTKDLSIDPIGLAWYFSNGVVHYNRTIFNEIRRLDRASCYIYYADKKEEVLQYWLYQFTNEYADRNINYLKDELSGLLIESVRKRVTNDSPIFLSLSGGYDAAGILGILNEKLNIDNLFTFTYGISQTLAEGDAQIARRMAEIYGNKHQTYLSYDGKFCDAIERNALWGDGLSYFCDESLVWNGFSDTIEKQDFPLFVGDECFGWADTDLTNHEDALLACRIWDFNSLSWLRGFIANDIFNKFLEGQNQDINAILKKIPNTNDLHDVKDFVYLDQRLSHMILPWREHYANRVFRLQDPFLDNSILDFMQKIPSKWRRGKNLYKETITSMFPLIFGVNRATVGGYVPDWNKEIQNEKGSITLKYFQKANPSMLDEFIDPASVIRLISIEDETQYKLLLNSYKTLKKVFLKMGKNKSKQILPLKITRTVFLIRYLILKRFLEIAKEDSQLQKEMF